MPDNHQGIPICGDCQVAMVESYQVTCIYLDLHDQPTLIRYGDQYECPGCHRRIVTGFAKYLATTTDPDFRDELRKATEFPGEVRYVYPVPKSQVEAK